VSGEGLPGPGARAPRPGRRRGAEAPGGVTYPFDGTFTLHSRDQTGIPTEDE